MLDRGAFKYTFHNIARVIDRFTEVVGLDRFAIYVFDSCPGGEFPVGAKFESAMVPATTGLQVLRRGRR
jgi:hypothetical protein